MNGGTRRNSSLGESATCSRCRRDSVARFPFAWPLWRRSSSLSKERARFSPEPRQPLGTPRTRCLENTWIAGYLALDEDDPEQVHRRLDLTSPRTDIARKRWRTLGSGYCLPKPYRPNERFAWPWRGRNLIEGEGRICYSRPRSTAPSATSSSRCASRGGDVNLRESII